MQNLSTTRGGRQPSKKKRRTVDIATVEQMVVEFPTDTLMEILHRLPSKSLARFKCVSRSWKRFIFDSSNRHSCRSLRWKPSPHMIGFYIQPIENQPSTQFVFSPNEGTLETARENFDKSVDFLHSSSLYIVASSNGFLLCCKQEIKHRNYYVYNPATRQYLVLPVTQMCVKDVAIGFHCKVDDPNEDLISFNIVRYCIPGNRRLPMVVKTESFSSQTNTWTKNTLKLHKPHILYGSSIASWLTSAGAIDGVFYWLNGDDQITVYDSVGECFGSLDLPEEDDDDWVFTRFLGVSGEILCYAWTDIGFRQLNVWHLKSSTWERKYDLVLPDTLYTQCGIEHHSDIWDMKFHPAHPHIVYLDIDGKFICYDMDTSSADLVCETHYHVNFNFFPYEWHQWPRLLRT